MMPIEHSVAGRAADNHQLLRNACLRSSRGRGLRVRHLLSALPAASVLAVIKALSHTQAVGQCRNTLRKLGLHPVPEADAAGSARLVAEANEPTLAAIASSLAAQIYGLKV